MVKQNLSLLGFLNNYLLNAFSILVPNREEGSAWVIEGKAGLAPHLTRQEQLSVEGERGLPVYV